MSTFRTRLAYTFLEEYLELAEEDSGPNWGDMSHLYRSATIEIN